MSEKWWIYQYLVLTWYDRYRSDIVPIYDNSTRELILRLRRTRFYADWVWIYMDLVLQDQHDLSLEEMSWFVWVGYFWFLGWWNYPELECKLGFIVVRFGVRKKYCSKWLGWILLRCGKNMLSVNHNLPEKLCLSYIELQRGGTTTQYSWWMVSMFIENRKGGTMTQL